MMKLLKNLLIILMAIAFAILIYFGVKNKWYNYIINPGCDHQIIIDDLNSELEKKQHKIDELTGNLQNNQETISRLNNLLKEKDTAINNYIARIEELNNELLGYENSNNVTELKNKIIKLNNDISELNSQITKLQTEKQELQSTIDELLAQTDNQSKVVATYMIGDTIYKNQIVTKNSAPDAIEAPTSTDYVIFNYWELNGQRVDPTQVVLTSNTTFVANVTYKYKVSFVDGETEYTSQIIQKNDIPTRPTNPTKDGYKFIGWSLNGKDVITQFEEVTNHTIYLALWEKLDFIQLNSDSLCTNLWVDADNNIYGISSDATPKNYKFNKETNTWVEISMTGFTLTSANVDYIWNDGTNTYFSDGRKQYQFNNDTFEWTIKEWNMHLIRAYIWDDGTNIYYSIGASHYLLNKESNTWNSIEFKGVVEFNGSDVKKLGNNAYYITADKQYVLDKSLNMWNEVIWNNNPANFSPDRVWSDGSHIYYSIYGSNYELDLATSTWITKTWTNCGGCLNGREIRKVEDDIYFLFGKCLYKLNK